MIEAEIAQTAGLVTAYWAKDGIQKLLGPTCEYLGGELRDFTKRRVENITNILNNATKKLGADIETPGIVPPKVLMTVMHSGQTAESVLEVEYLGGILASSRTKTGKDDRGAAMVTLVSGLSAYQLRMHYLIYSTISRMFKSRPYLFNVEDRVKMKIFIPYEDIFEAMEWTDDEENQLESLFVHIFFGLYRVGLIGKGWQYGEKEDLKSELQDIPSAGVILHPSASGAELLLWACGFYEKPLKYIIDPSFNLLIEGIPNYFSNAIEIKGE